MEHRTTALCSLLGRQECLPYLRQGYLPYLRPVASWLIIIVMVFYRRRCRIGNPARQLCSWRLHGSLPAAVARDIARKRQQPQRLARCPHVTTSSTIVSLGQAAGFRKVRTALLKDRRVANMVEKALQDWRKQAAALPPAAYAVKPRAYAGVARGVPGTDQQGSERVHPALRTKSWGGPGSGYGSKNATIGFQRGIVFPHCRKHNPVRAGLAKRAQDWPWSSAHR